MLKWTRRLLLLLLLLCKVAPSVLVVDIATAALPVLAIIASMMLKRMNAPCCNCRHGDASI